MRKKRSKVCGKSVRISEKNKANFNKNRIKFTLRNSLILCVFHFISHTLTMLFFQHQQIHIYITRLCRLESLFKSIVQFHVSLNSRGSRHNTHTREKGIESLLSVRQTYIYINEIQLLNDYDKPKHDDL